MWPETSCQVLVVGAGPAGGDLARQLACAGVNVLLIDQLADLSQAAFSSAAMPLEAMDRFGLPAELAASRWSCWELIGPGQQRRHWRAGRPLGVVLEFGALRQWLADQTRQWGGKVRLGLRATTCLARGDGMLTQLLDRQGRRLQVQSAWVVDATGQTRGLLGDPRPAAGDRGGGGKDDLVSGVGVEWLLQVPAATWERWADRLSFCMGSDWVRQGYGWVFPMQPGRLKVGVCRLKDPDAPQPSLGGVLGSLLQRLLDPEEWAATEVIDRHGGLIRSSIKRREDHRRGRLIGLGDAVSTANLLGGEGIRHALTSSRVLAPLLIEVLRNELRQGSSGNKAEPGEAAEVAPLDAYPARLRRALGWRWPVSGQLARRTWLGLKESSADRRLERLLNGLQHYRAEDLSALLFGYRFERYGCRMLPYLLGWR